MTALASRMYIICYTAHGPYERTPQSPSSIQQKPSNHSDALSTKVTLHFAKSPEPLTSRKQLELRFRDTGRVIRGSPKAEVADVFVYKNPHAQLERFSIHYSIPSTILTEGLLSPIR